MVHTRSSRSVIAALILIVASACSDTTNANGKALSLSFATKPTASASRIGGSGPSLLTQTVNGHTLVIDVAQVVMSKIELTSNVLTVCTDDSSSSDCEELKADPSVVDLPTTTGVTTALVKSVPPGTYSAFEGKVHVVTNADPGGMAFLTANPSFTGVSVHATGTYDGAPFTYDGTAGAELELEFATPIVVDANGLNITVNVDLATWFVDGSGALVDPTTANGSGPNSAMVAQNIHQSFEAFEDDDKDGIDDSTEH